MLLGLGQVFMPPIDEGWFLYMATMVRHASVGEAIDALQLRLQNQLLVSFPEVELVVGKIGLTDTPLGPASVWMIETYIAYKSEYRTDEGRHRVNFRYDAEAHEYVRDDDGELILDTAGRPDSGACVDRSRLRRHGANAHPQL